MSSCCLQVNGPGSFNNRNNVANANAGDELGATQLISGQNRARATAIAVGDYLLGEIQLKLLRLSDVTAFIELMAATDSVRRAREARKLPSRALTFTTCMPQMGRWVNDRKWPILLGISKGAVIGGGKLTCHPELLRSV